MKPIEKLDTILRLLVEDERLKPSATENTILKIMYPTQDIYSIKPIDILKALEHLQNDGYIQSKTFEEYVEEMGENLYYTKYKTTFKGELFYEQGGYNRQLEKETNINRIRNLERILLTIGTLLAGLYGLVEIVKAALHWKPGNGFLLSIELWTAGLLFSFGVITGLIIWLIAQHLLRPKE